MNDKTKNATPGQSAGGEKDPMASAVKKAGDGASQSEIEQAAKDAEARQMQDAIDQKERAKQTALSDDERATLAKISSDRAEREKLRPAAPVIGSTTAEKARPGEVTVTMIFPKAMFIWAEPDHMHPLRHKVQFGAGPQQVPESLADNWYLRANGVKKYHGSDKERAE